MKAIFQPVIVMAFCFAGVVEAATTAAELEAAIKRGDTLEQIVALSDEGPEVNYKVTLLPYNPAEAMAALLDNGAPRTPAMPWDAPRCPILSNTTSSSLRTAGSTTLLNGPAESTSSSLYPPIPVTVGTSARTSPSSPPPTGGKSTCTLTGKPTTIQAEKNHLYWFFLPGITVQLLAASIQN